MTAPEQEPTTTVEWGIRCPNPTHVCGGGVFMTGDEDRIRAYAAKSHGELVSRVVGEWQVSA